jgi:hypothetical protein
MYKTIPDRYFPLFPGGSFIYAWPTDFIIAPMTTRIPIRTRKTRQPVQSFSLASFSRRCSACRRSHSACWACWRWLDAINLSASCRSISSGVMGVAHCGQRRLVCVTRILSSSCEPQFGHRHSYLYFATVSIPQRKERRQIFFSNYSGRKKTSFPMGKVLGVRLVLHDQ